MEERKIGLEAQVMRTISFGGFNPEQIPNESLEVSACQMFVHQAQHDPTPLLNGCTLCQRQGQRTAVKRAYVAFVGVTSPSGTVDLTIQFTLLCDQHAQDAIRPSIPFRNTAYELSTYEMQVLQEFVVGELVMPDAIWIVEIEFSDLDSDGLVSVIIDASRN